jgi:hypothetical protein
MMFLVPFSPRFAFKEIAVSESQVVNSLEVCPTLALAVESDCIKFDPSSCDPALFLWNESMFKVCPDEMVGESNVITSDIEAIRFPSVRESFELQAIPLELKHEREECDAHLVCSVEEQRTRTILQVVLGN